MLFTMFVLSLPFFIYISVYIRSAKRHDRIIGNFYGIRQKIIFIVANNNKNISLKNFELVKNIGSIVNQSIATYKESRRVLFNIELFEMSVKGYREVYDAIDNLENNLRNYKEEKKQECEEILSIYRELKIALLIAFVTYMPFIYTPLIIFGSSTKVNKALLYAEKILLGYGRTRRYLSQANIAIKMLDDQTETLGIRLQLNLSRSCPVSVKIMDEPKNYPLLYSFTFIR